MAGFAIACLFFAFFILPVIFCCYGIMRLNTLDAEEGYD